MNETMPTQQNDSDDARIAWPGFLQYCAVMRAAKSMRENQKAGYDALALDDAEQLDIALCALDVTKRPTLTEYKYPVLSMRKNSLGELMLYGRNEVGEFWLFSGDRKIVEQQKAAIESMIRLCGGDPGGMQTRPDRVAAVALIDKWLADESGYDKAAWPKLRDALLGGQRD